MKLKPVNSRDILERFEPPTTRTDRELLREYRLAAALVYQDPITRAWAQQVRELLAEQVDDNAINLTHWNIEHLKEPGCFTRGVQALATADVIVIALREADRLPGSFYTWVNLWLQVRSGAPGALVGLVGAPRENAPESCEARQYLQAVAGQGRLELFMKACECQGLSTEPATNCLKP